VWIEERGRIQHVFRVVRVYRKCINDMSEQARKMWSMIKESQSVIPTYLIHNLSEEENGRNNIRSKVVRGQA
jgi:hypothetical protein